MIAALSATVARGQSLTIQGKVMDGANNPVAGSATEFRVKILAPDGSGCVLFNETHTLDLSQSLGLFSLNLSNGSGTPNAPNTYSLEQALSNRSAFVVNTTHCNSGSGTHTYTPGPTDNRKVVIEFRDPVTMGSSWETIPEMDLNPVAFAMEARTVGGFAHTSLLRVVGGGIPGTAPALTPADLTELQSVLAGTSSKYMTRSANNGAQMPTYPGNPSSPTTGSIWYDTTANSVKYYDGTATQTLGSGSGAGTITGVTAGAGLSGGGSSGPVSLALATLSPSPAGTVGSSTSIPVLTVDAHGRVTAASSATISSVAPSGAATGDLTGTYPSPTVARLRGFAFAPTAPANGQIYKFDTKGTPATSDDEFVPSNIFASDLKSASLGALLPTTCGTNERWYWDSGTGAYACTPLAGITGSQLENYGPGVTTLVKVTTDAHGRVTSGSASLAASDIPALDWAKISSGTPTTLGGYGIADALRNADGSVPSISSGTEAAMPAPVAGNLNHLYIANDTKKIFRQMAGTWEVIGAAPGAGFTGSLAGEISGTQGATQVNSINGITRATITSNLNAVSGATDLNTASTLVKRDAAGNFVAGAITASELNLRNGANAVGLRAASGTAAYSLQLPATAPAANQSLQSDASGVLSWVNAAAGSISNILSGTGISVTGSGATRTVTLADTAVSPNSYGSATQVPTFTVDQQGRLTAASNVTITGTTPGGSAGGDLSGSYPNPSVAKLQTVAVSSVTPSLGQVLKYVSSNWAASTLELNDLKASDGTTSAVNSAVCTASQTMYYDTGTKSLRCMNIGSLASAAITDLDAAKLTGTIDAARLPATAKYWDAATGGINYAGGNVGVGTSNPAAKLHVVGETLASSKMSIGSSGYADLNVVANGTIYQNGGDAFTRIQSTGAGNARVQLQSNGPSGGSTAANHEAGRIDFGGRGGSAWVDQAASIKGVAETLWSGSTNPMALTFSTTTGTTIGERMRISGNGNVGIGTTDPAARLSVTVPEASGAREHLMSFRLASDANARGGIMNATSANGTFVPTFWGYRPGTMDRMVTSFRGFTDAAGDVAGNENALVDISGMVTDNPTDPINGNQWNPSNRNILSVSSWDGPLMVVGPSGAVGIGTTAPNSFAKLHIKPSGSATSGLLLDKSDNAEGGEIVYNDNTTSWANDIHYGNFRFNQMGGNLGGFIRTAFTITKEANVGINTETPGAGLDVDTKAAGSAIIVPRDTVANRPVPVNGMIRYATDTNALEARINGQWVNIATVGGTSSFTTAAAGAGSNSAPSYTFSGDTNTGFYNTSSNDTISVAAGGAKIFDMSSAGLVSPTTGGASVLTANGTAAAPTYSFAGDLGTGWFRAAASTLAASTGGVERMRIDSSGNVGVGTTNPSTPLHVWSAAAATTNKLLTLANNNATGSSGVGIVARLGAGNTERAMLSMDAGGGGAGQLHFFNDLSGTPTERFTILENGNVGIGTTAPNAKLSFGSYSTNLTGASPSHIRLYEIGTDIYGLGVSAAQLNYFAGGGGHVFFNGAAGSEVERMRISAAGNVGIGTTNPSYKLQVSGGAWINQGGDISSRAAGLGVTVAPTADFAAGVDPGDSNRGLTVGAKGATRPAILSIRNIDASVRFWDLIADPNNNGALTFASQHPGSTAVMTLGTGGNVGIGTTSPGAPLQVNGTTSITGGWNGNAANGLHLGFGSNIGTIYSIQNGVSWRRLDIDANTLNLNSNTNANVGIGTNNPAATLHVATSAGFPLYLQSKNYGSTYWNVGPFNGTNHFYIIDENSQGLYVTKGSGATGWTVNSDRRLKTGITPLSESSGLAAILKLKPVTYRWRDQRVSQDEQTGFIAQDVEAVLPNLVTHGRDSDIVLADGTKEHIPDTRGVNYTGFVVPLVKAVQELQKQIWEIVAGQRSEEARVAKLEAESASKAREIASLKEANLRLQREMEALKAAKEKEATAVKARLERLEKLLAR